MERPTIQPNLKVDAARSYLKTTYGLDFPSEFFFRPESATPDGTFEFALCFAGSVSAGAYLAGVADFLIEALDCWEAAKKAGTPGIPTHTVRLNAMSGTSGGGMTSLILASALGRKITPARAGKSSSLKPPENPLYATWVKGIDITQLLGVGDLADEKAKVQSLLDSRRISTLAQEALTGSSEVVTRSYVANPLHVGVTIGNLNGFEHEFALKGPTAYGYSARVHEDVVRFSFEYQSPLNVGMPANPMADPVELSARPIGGPLSQWLRPWQLVGQAAMATGAFPVGLLPRDVLRDWTRCEPRILPIELGTGGTVALLPALHAGAPTKEYSCLCVDGGTFNNEPFEVARTALCGLLGSNKRTGVDAKRAVVMVDPLVVAPGDDFERLRDSDTVIRLISGLVMRSFVDQSRTHLREWTSAMAEDIYSRYLLAPSKGTASGEDAICGSVLGAFGGFLSEAYREHDFRLGRRNCQRFLQEHFALPDSNPLFNGWRDKAEMLGKYRCATTDPVTKLACIPIIPLVGAVTETEPEPNWPSRQEFILVREKIYALLEKRIDVLYEHLVADQSWLVRRYLGLGWTFAKPDLLKKVHAAIEDALKAKQLF
jgi:hypothetical protein